MIYQAAARDQKSFTGPSVFSISFAEYWFMGEKGQLLCVVKFLPVRTVYAVILT